MKKLLVLNGPNLNLLGEREPGIYGDVSFDKLNAHLLERAAQLGLECEIFQSNHEGAIIDKLHAARTEFYGVVINAGAYTHTSLAIADAIAAIKLPVVEVHISNVHAREAVRHTSMISPVCVGVIAGFGLDSYRLGVEALLNR